MTYQWFCSTLTECVREKTGGQAEVSVHRIPKNNGIYIDGMSILEDGTTITPSIYLNQYYQEYLEGVSVEEIADKIIACYRSGMQKRDVPAYFYTEFSNLKEYIYLRLVNYSMNSELFPNVCMTRFLDLACIYYYRFPDYEMKDASILVKERDLARWNISIEELHNKAFQNTFGDFAYEMRPIEDVIREIDVDIFAEEEAAEDPPCIMLVLTNNTRMYGAAALMNSGLLADCAASLDSDLVILPSSIHELIIIPEDAVYDIEDLNETIREVNATQVAPTEVLSDHVYFYRRKNYVVSC